MTPAARRRSADCADCGTPEGAWDHDSALYLIGGPVCPDCIDDEEDEEGDW